MAQRDRRDRQKRRDDQDRLDDEIRQAQARAGQVSATRAEEHISRQATGEADSERFLELLSRVESDIERLDSLYNQFFAGVERRPPLEVRKQVEQGMQKLTAMPKPTPALKFR